MRKSLFVLLVAVLLAGCSWAQFHGDAARTGFQPFESKIGSSTVGSLTEVWTAQVGPTSSSPVVAGGRVYIGEGDFPNSPGFLTVFDAAGRANCSGTPKVCKPVWGVQTGGSVRHTAVANGIVYVNYDIGILAAYDVAACEASLQCSPLWGADAFGSPAVSGGVVYAGSFEADGVSAYDAAGTTNCSVTPGGRFCEPLWTTSTDEIGTVAVARGVVYANSRNGILYAYDAAGQTNCAGAPKVCEPLWIALAGSSSSPVVGEGRVYLMDDSARLLRVFDAAGVANCFSGTRKVCVPLWTAPVPLSPADSSSHYPAVGNGRVYVGNAVFDAAGQTNCSGTPKVCDPLWRVSGDGQLPIVANGIEFVGGAVPSSGDALRLHAFDATGNLQCTGRAPIVCAPLWTVDPGGSIDGSPAIVNGVLYVVTRGDPLVPFDRSTLHTYAPE